MDLVAVYKNLFTTDGLCSIPMYPTKAESSCPGCLSPSLSISNPGPCLTALATQVGRSRPWPRVLYASGIRAALSFGQIHSNTAGWVGQGSIGNSECSGSIRLTVTCELLLGISSPALMAYAPGSASGWGGCRITNVGNTPFGSPLYIAATPQFDPIKLVVGAVSIVCTPTPGDPTCVVGEHIIFEISEM